MSESLILLTRSVWVYFRHIHNGTYLTYTDTDPNHDAKPTNPNRNSKGNPRQKSFSYIYVHCITSAGLPGKLLGALSWLRSIVGGTPVFGRQTDPVLRSTFS